MLLAAALLAVSALRAAPTCAAADDLARLLAAAVDLPTPEARRDAAVKLAGREDVTLEAWLTAMRAFGVFERVAAGSRTEKAPLQVAAAREEAVVAVFVPKSHAPGKPAPLVFALHGAGGEGHDEDALWTEAAEQAGALVVAPTDPAGDLGLKYGQAARQRPFAALRWARRRFDVDENRIVLTGVSRGGHLTWDLATRCPDHFAAIAPMIGGPRLTIAEGQNNLRYVENVAHMPIRDLQGARDDSLLLENLRLAFRRLEAAGARDARLVEFSDRGHDFDPHAVDWKEFLARAVREPMRPRVVRACARLDEARSAWAEVTRFAAGIDETFRPDISAAELKKLDESGKRAWVQGEADRRTARLEVKMDDVGRFTATTSGVQRFRLLLPAEMFVARAPVEVTTNGRLARYEAKASKLVLLREFVERFDRTFLPVAEISCP